MPGGGTAPVGPGAGTISLPKKTGGRPFPDGPPLVLADSVDLPVNQEQRSSLQLEGRMSGTAARKADCTLVGDVRRRGVGIRLDISGTPKLSGFEGPLTRAPLAPCDVLYRLQARCHIPPDRRPPSRSLPFSPLKRGAAHPLGQRRQAPRGDLVDARRPISERLGDLAGFETQPVLQSEDILTTGW